MPRESGFSLIELIVFIVIISIGITGILLPIATSIRNSADPLIARQMVLIADSLMDEIMGKDLGTTTVSCGGTVRADFDIVDCYAGYTSTGIQTIDGSPIAGLTDYSVSVAITNAAFTNVTATDARRITVTVTRGSNSFTLEGYRLAYE